MATRQKIVRIRREYNQWAANQTLEDYALRFTATSARKWSSLRVANTALGAISFLALEAIGGTITLAYGFTNSVTAILVVGALIFATGLPISYYAARYGVDIDLLTRGAGFGYIGSTITSLIYASFTFIFFAIEAVIMSTALDTCFGVPLPIGYILSSLVVIPLVTHGITFISRFQLWTQPVWIVLHALPFVFLAVHSQHAFGDWTRFPGVTPAGAVGDGSGFRLVAFGAAASVVLSLIAQIGEQVDFLRFLPPRRRHRPAAWWGALLCAGPGWIVLGTLKLLGGSFLAFLAVRSGIAITQAAQPTQMYLVAFRTMIASPEAALLLTGFFVIVSQLKINVTNSYAGSIAWSNFFSRLTHRHPGRVVWLVFNVVIALLLIELGVYAALEQILALYSTVAAAWVGALVADLVVNKPLGLSPPHIEFKRAHLYDINPVGVGAMVVATALAMAAYSGAFGTVIRAFTPFVALLAAFVTAPAIAYATEGKYYLARRPRRNWLSQASVRCCICENDFEPEDAAYCPAYSGPICSLCCSLDARCGDACKVHGRFASQVAAILNAALPASLVAALPTRLARYLILLVSVAGVIGVTLAVIYAHTALTPDMSDAVVRAAFLKIFFIAMIIAGVAAWLFVLTQENRQVAEEESRRQTRLLMREIEAHKRTDAKLERAREVAEAANHAKSRFVVGISHELRSPLNSILGYAQLLERDGSIPPHRRDAIRTIRRSGDHLAGLIEGLLDISKIEAGRLHLQRDAVELGEFLEQIVDMFRLQAMAKNIAFRFECADGLPTTVYADKKRLRQILINLLSNAIKFTVQGEVALGIRMRSQVAEIEIRDTGVGIDAADLTRIFEPFERVERAGVPSAPGMGLGLTITKMLTEIMGGELSVTSTPGCGSTFRVRLMLSEAPDIVRTVAARVIGYAGRRRTVLVADDDGEHRDLVRDLLQPLGFILFEAADGIASVQIAEQCRPDIVLLDLSMPGMTGWQVAQALRESHGGETVIIMVSANAAEPQPADHPDAPHDAYIVKPLDIDELLQTIGEFLEIAWVTDSALEPVTQAPAIATGTRPAEFDLSELRRLGRIGHVRGILAKLDEIGSEDPAQLPFVTELRSLVSDLELGLYMAALEAAERRAHA
jgi:signal transduction histidine kinase/CheY-like chemotaxis protein